MFGKLIAHKKALRKANVGSQYLYQHLVQHARNPQFYQPPFHVEDTVEGRFELILIHLFIIDYWLSKSDQTILLRRALQELLVTDMDRSLREMGIGDMSVGKQMKKVGAALLGRLQSYKLVFETADKNQYLEIKVAEIMARNIDGIERVEDCRALASYFVEQIASVTTLDPQTWETGEAVFAISDANTRVSTGETTKGGVDEKDI